MTQPTSDLDKKIEADFESCEFVIKYCYDLTKLRFGGYRYGDTSRLFNGFKAAALPLHQKIAELEKQIDSASEGYEEWFEKAFNDYGYKEVLKIMMKDAWQASRLSMMKENQALRETVSNQEKERQSTEAFWKKKLEQESNKVLELEAKIDGMGDFNHDYIQALREALEFMLKNNWKALGTPSQEIELCKRMNMYRTKFNLDNEGA